MRGPNPERKTAERALMYDTSQPEHTPSTPAASRTSCGFQNSLHPQTWTRQGPDACTPRHPSSDKVAGLGFEEAAFDGLDGKEA